MCINYKTYYRNVSIKYQKYVKQITAIVANSSDTAMTLGYKILIIISNRMLW